MAKSLHQGGEFITPYLHVFVEELSAKIVLDTLIPKIIPNGVYYHVHSHQGKQDLESAIKKTIPSISKIPGAFILIVRDQDNEDCKKVKQNIINILTDKAVVAPTLIRIVCRELESWFLGDLNAVSKAYPRLNIKHHINKAEFRQVDMLQNTDKVLLSIIPEFSDREYLPKLEVAESIAPHLDLSCNSSESFNQFIKGVVKLLQANI